MKISILLIFILFASSAIFAKPTNAESGKCLYPGSPINWVMKYCSLIAETDDEIAIQESKCFKDALKDISANDECATNMKYKIKTCERILKSGAQQYKTVDDCVKNSGVKPFIVGN